MCSVNGIRTSYSVSLLVSDEPEPNNVLAWHLHFIIMIITGLGEIFT